MSGSKSRAGIRLIGPKYAGWGKASSRDAVVRPMDGGAGGFAVFDALQSGK
jgi:hypothetical protein